MGYRYEKKEPESRDPYELMLEDAHRDLKILKGTTRKVKFKLTELAKATPGEPLCNKTHFVNGHHAHPWDHNDPVWHHYHCCNHREHRETSNIPMNLLGATVNVLFDGDVGIASWSGYVSSKEAGVVEVVFKAAKTGQCGYTVTIALNEQIVPVSYGNIVVEDAAS